MKCPSIAVYFKWTNVESIIPIPKVLVHCLFIPQHIFKSSYLQHKLEVLELNIIQKLIIGAQQIEL
jgi:hypothetical protein